jgi:hypothetical protein
MSDPVALAALERFKCALRTGRATRSHWPLWCAWCDEPQLAVFGDPPLTECKDCRKASYELVSALEATVERGGT